MSASTPHARATSDGDLVKPPKRYKILDDALAEQIANFVKITGSLRTACEAAGVPWETARYWLKQARKGREPYVDFATKVKAARALREVGLHYTIQQHAMTTKEQRGDWRAAMAELNRIEWARRGQQKNAAMRPPNAEETVILMYPVRVEEGEGGVRLQPLEAPALPPPDVFEAEGEDVTDADE